MSANNNLMRAMGAPRFDPMPPGQHEWFLYNGLDVDRLVALIWQHTIAINHPCRDKEKGFGDRCPYAVDEKGNPVKADFVTNYFHWDPAYTRRILRQAIAQGRIKVDKRGRIWLCGTVTPVDMPENTEEDTTGPAEQTEKKKDCTRYIPPYILAQIQAKPKEERERILAEEGAAADRRDRMAADAAALVRAQCEREQDERFKQYGLPERRRIAESKQKRKSDVPMTVQITFVDLDAAAGADLVQSSADERTVQDPKTDHVQSSYPYLLEINTEKQQQHTPAAVPAVATNVVVAESPIVLEELRKHGVVTHQTAAKFEADCRQIAPDATPESIVSAIQTVSSTFTRSTKNPVGVLLTQVPAAIKSYRRQEPQQAAAAAALRAEQDREIARNVLKNPELISAGARDEMVRWARETLGLKE